MVKAVAKAGPQCPDFESGLTGLITAIIDVVSMDPNEYKPPQCEAKPSNLIRLVAFKGLIEPLVSFVDAELMCKTKVVRIGSVSDPESSPCSSDSGTTKSGFIGELFSTLRSMHPGKSMPAAEQSYFIDSAQLLLRSLDLSRAAKRSLGDFTRHFVSSLRGDSQIYIPLWESTSESRCHTSHRVNSPLRLYFVRSNVDRHDDQVSRRPQ